MPRLIVYGDPVLVAAHPGHALGDVIDVLADGHELSAEERGHFIVVDVGGDLDELKAAYLAPSPARQALADARAALDRVDPEDAGALAAAQATVDRELAAAQGAPERALRIDLGALPRENVQGPQDFRAALDAVKVEAKAAARAALESAMLSTMLPVDTLGYTSKTSAQIIEAQKDERVVDLLRCASCAGRASVEAPVIERFVAPRPVALDASALAAVTVSR